MRKIHVLHVAHFNEMGGIQTRLFDLLCQPVKNFDFYLFSPRPITAYWQKKFNFLKIKFDQATGSNWLEELVRFALTYKIDIAHFHQPWYNAQRKLKKAGIKIIIEHDQGASWRRQPKAKSNIKTVDAVIALSKASKTMLQERLGYNPSKIHLIYYGIDFNQLIADSPVPRPPKTIIITTICRLVSIKGIDAILKAVPLVLNHRKDVEFWIVGDGPARDELIKLAETLEITDYVKFWLNQTEIAKFYASTDLFVLASVREPLGSVLIEAGYFGIPTIASNVDGIPEIIISGKTGILINPTEPFHPLTEAESVPDLVVDVPTGKLRKPCSLDHIELGTAILNFINHPELCRTMGAEARKRVIELYDVQRYRIEIIRLYRRLLKQKGIV